MPTFKSKVDLVVLTFTVTDGHGRYINNLKPSDFKVFEDTIPEKITTFEEGNKPVMQVMDDGTLKPIIQSEAPQPEASATPNSAAGLDPHSDAFTGTNV